MIWVHNSSTRCILPAVVAHLFVLERIALKKQAESAQEGTTRLSDQLSALHSTLSEKQLTLEHIHADYNAQLGAAQQRMSQSREETFELQRTVQSLKSELAQRDNSMHVFREIELRLSQEAATLREQLQETRARFGQQEQAEQQAAERLKQATHLLSQFRQVQLQLAQALTQARQAADRRQAHSCVRARHVRMLRAVRRHLTDWTQQGSGQGSTTSTSSMIDSTAATAAATAAATVAPPVSSQFLSLPSGAGRAGSDHASVRSVSPLSDRIEEAMLDARLATELRELLLREERETDAAAIVTSMPSTQTTSQQQPQQQLPLPALTLSELTPLSRTSSTADALSVLSKYSTALGSELQLAQAQWQQMSTAYWTNNATHRRRDRRRVLCRRSVTRR